MSFLFFWPDTDAVFLYLGRAVRLIAAKKIILPVQIFDNFHQNKHKPKEESIHEFRGPNQNSSHLYAWRHQ